MENASKAILIAGGVLVALMLISVGIYIWNIGRGTSIAAEERRMATIIQEQNTKFSQYIGEIYGSEVENCIRRVMSYNSSNIGNPITVTVEVGGVTKIYNGNQHVVNQINDTGTIIDAVTNQAVSNIIKTNIVDTARNDLYNGSITTNIQNGMISVISFKKI